VHSRRLLFSCSDIPPQAALLRERALAHHTKSGNHLADAGFNPTTSATRQGAVRMVGVSDGHGGR